MTLFQTIVTLIWNKQFFVLQIFSFFSFDFNNDVDFSFFHCRHVDFVTTKKQVTHWNTNPAVP